MGILSIKNNEKLVNSYEVDSVKKANAFVQENAFPLRYNFVYSTFNDAGIENTINLRKSEI